MTGKSILRQLFHASTVWSQNKVGAELGLKSQAMQHRMRASDIKVGFMADALGVLGYQLIVVPPHSKLPKGAIVVTSDEEES